ncbi:MAG: flagellar biosynthesis protein FlhB [Actinobacteria bacterium]|nr:flagellar biosynthesis protein FlhB [Actinomycetota bacterium]
MAGGDKHSKTEAPTQKRKKEARKDGQVIRSDDLVTWVSVLAATWVLPMLIRSGSAAARNAMLLTLQIARQPDEGRLTASVGEVLRSILGAVLPTLVIMLVIGVAGNVAQVGLLLTGKPLKPKFDRVNPFKGIKRMFSVQSVWDTVTASAKLTIIVAVAYNTLSNGIAELIAAAPRSITASLGEAAALSLSLVRTIAFAALMLALFDYAFRRWKQFRDMRMTKQEIKQESKDSDGDPHVKGRQRQIRMQASRNRMLAAIKDADVVITNPTHFAIAIEYDAAYGVPRVVARGVDALAQTIKAEAAEHKVPQVESRPLARALYAVCRVGEEIPPELFQAVATVLAFIQRLSDAQKTYGGTFNLNVPDTWTSEGQPLERVAPTRRKMLAKKAARDVGIAAAEVDASVAPT